jgi:putative FmdB family regulatory protein
MPVYQYQCRNCESTFEQRRPFNQSSDPADCPTCGSDHTRKLLAAVRFISNGGSAGPMAADSIPVSMSGGGGCGCGSCSCGSH